MLISTISQYRKLFASLLALWMGLIVLSGIVFMHKEVTSDGEIITHIHPYDFTNKNKNHHKSDAEIRYLDVVFYGSFTKPIFYSINSPILQDHEESLQPYYFISYQHPFLTNLFARGPPTLV